MSNKRLPVAPADMTNISQEQQCAVSPLDQPWNDTCQYSNQSDPSQSTSSNSSVHNNEKLRPSVSESTLVSKTWQPPATTKSKGFGRWWPWEWLCELLALASLGAMIFVLLQYNNKPQADWQISYFTLNGLIAFLATLTKTGIIIPVSAAIGQRKWLRFLPNSKGRRNARRLGDFETFDEASRGSLGSAKLIFSLNAWYDCRLHNALQQLTPSPGMSPA